MEDKPKNKLLAISGGPDSMYLLYWYRKEKNIIVAHVNYNKRKDSSKDQKIVERFCEKYKLKCEILDIKEENRSNFQNWARKKRYDFFSKIYKKYNCKKLILAHHKDDFIETALIQQKSKRKPRYFGIKEKNYLFGMSIYRPFVNLYWKSEIINQLSKYKIKYATDYTNAQPIYERNKIRIELSGKTIKEKNSIYKWFKMSNKILKKKFKIIDRDFVQWQKDDFSFKKFWAMKNKQELIYELINFLFEDIKLSKGKLDSLINFVCSNEGNKKYKLKDNVFLYKKDGKLLSKV